MAVLLTLSASMLACGSAAAPAAAGEFPSSSPAATAVARGDRRLGIDVSEAAGETFGQAFSVAREAGLQFASLSVAWDDLEPAPAEFAPEPNWLTAANVFYATEGVPLALTIATIDTNRLRLPADLQDRSFDDPVVIARFERLLDDVFIQIPDLELAVLAIGNEVDAALGADEEAWGAYRTFFNAVSAHARDLRPGLAVGVKMTMEGLTGEARSLARSMNAAADMILVTYYPLDSDFAVRLPEVVRDDLAALVALYPGRPIALLEAGYPSSERLGSSETLQAEFVRSVFQAWDDHADQVGMINFTWLTDAPEASLGEWADYYGLHDDRFAAFLGTLGLRHADGTPKPALETLTEAAHTRGW